MEVCFGKSRQLRPYISRPLDALHSCSNFPASLQRSRQRDLIRVLQIAAHRNALRDPGDADAERFYQPRDVERGRLALHRRIGGDDHLLDSLPEPRHQLPQLQLIRTDAVERRERAVQHVIAPAKLARALDGEEVGHRLHHADHPRVALRVPADRAGVVGGEVAAGGAEAHLLAEREQRLGQVAGVSGFGLEDVEHESLRRLLAYAGKLRQQDGEARDRVGHFGKPGIPPRPAAMLESGFSAAAASWAAWRAEFTAASTRSSSMGTSRGSTASLSIWTFWISPFPLAVTTTIPPPAEPVTSFRARRSCASFICSWICCACWKSVFRSNPAMVSTPLPDRGHPRSRRPGPPPPPAPRGARGRGRSGLPTRRRPPSASAARPTHPRARPARRAAAARGTRAASRKRPPPRRSHPERWPPGRRPCGRRSAPRRDRSAVGPRARARPRRRACGRPGRTRSGAASGTPNPAGRGPA